MVVELNVTLPLLPTTTAVSTPPARSPPVPAMTPVPTCAAVGAQVIWSIVARWRSHPGAIVPVPVPTRTNRNFGMVIWKSTCAVAVRAPAPVWKFDSAVASMGAAMAAAASTLLMNNEVRMMLGS